MRNPFYLYWADSIISFKKHNPHRSDWKLALYILNTMGMTMILVSVLVVLKLTGVFTRDLYDFQLSKLRMINGFMNFAIQLASPALIINYFFVFHKARHKEIVKKYSDVKPRLSFYINIIGLWMAVIALVLYKVLS